MEAMLHSPLLLLTCMSTPSACTAAQGDVFDVTQSPFSPWHACMAVVPFMAGCRTCSAAPFTFLQDLSWKKPARQWEAVLDALASGRSAQPQGQAQAVPTPVQTPEHVARTEKATALR